MLEIKPANKTVHIMDIAPQLNDLNSKNKKKGQSQPRSKFKYAFIIMQL